MNKILFKQVEGKWKLFLMRGVPETPHAFTTKGGLNVEVGGDFGYMKYYEKCISEALKNGEIVNPEVVKEELWKSDERIHSPEWSMYHWETKMLKDGDTFDLPEGIGFEEVIVGPSLHVHSSFGSETIQKEAIRLLPEKPEQKEESVMTPDDKEWSNGYAKGYSDGSNKGFNEAIEEVLNIINTDDQDDRYPPGYFYERLEKLKR